MSEKLLVTIAIFLLNACTTFNTGNSNSPIPSAASESSFDHFTTSDRFGRKIQYYISNQSKERLPLILFIAGSGCESNFWKDDHGKIVGGYQDVLLKSLNGKAYIMVVEKPGVQFLEVTDKPGTAEKCSQVFKEEQTLERWAEALNAALNAAIKMPKIDTKKVIVIGHSEGAVMAPNLAAINSSITHVAAISGSGATQLFDFIVDKSSVDQINVYKNYELMLQSPDDTQNLFWGHPARRWISFMEHSTAEDLARTNAKILIAHGTSDTSVPIQSFDFLVADLKRRNKKFTFDRLEGASHSLNLPSETKSTGMRREFIRIASWAGVNLNN